MLYDRQGNSVSGASGNAVTWFDEAVHAFNIYRGDPFALLDQALQEAPEFAMARIAKAYMLATSSEPGAIAKARALTDQARPLQLNDREQSHVAALDFVFKGEWSQAAIQLDRHSISFPHDLLALQAGHLFDFLRGNARNLRDRIARALPFWSTDQPGHSFLLGMHAFGLEECGDYARAEDQGRRAVAEEPLDCWAHHAVTHVMEMQGRAQDGIGWMITREPFWSGDDNGFKVHNWWHRALFHLELGQTEDALELYDGPVREDRSGLVFDLVDATALLWRLHLAGIELGERWQEVADAWGRHADGVTYPFNDWHAAMAWLGAGRMERVEALITLQKANAAETETGHWVRQFGLPLTEGFAAFWNKDYKQASISLYAGRFITNAFGGSHAQRDIIDLTLLAAAQRGGLTHLAEALANERLALKPHVPPGP
jgi:tetratricopeptide (TPR) repeat protein